MSGAETALEAAILALLQADALVRAQLGDPIRVAEKNAPRPAYPFLEVARQESRDIGSSGFESREHRIDLGVASRAGAEEEGHAALAAICNALENPALAMTGWRCVLIHQVYRDEFRTQNGGRRGLLRLRAIIEATG